MNGHKEVVQLLIDKGADMNIQNKVSTMIYDQCDCSYETMNICMYVCMYVCMSHYLK